MNDVRQTGSFTHRLYQLKRVKSSLNSAHTHTETHTEQVFLFALFVTKRRTWKNILQTFDHEFHETEM